MIKRLPLITYWGRYSIMILCTHYLVAQIIDFCLEKFMSNIYILFILVFPLTLLVCHFLIGLMRKYMPYVTAQKDLFKVK